MGRLLAVVTVLFVAVGVVLFARGDVPCEVVATQPTCEVALRPGPSEDTLELVTINGTEAHLPADGELRLTTVAVQDDLTFGSWLSGRTSRIVEVVPRGRIYPEGSDPDEVAELNAAAMADSQLVAMIAALEQLGYELEPEGALVAGVTEDAVTDELEVGDVIVAVDGEPVAESVDVVELVQARRPGDELVLDVRGDDGPRQVELTLGESPHEPGKGFIGVFLTTELDLPVDIDIDAGVIGGPSAGMMFALSIVELLEEGDLIDGRVVAGTGTLDRDGEVGAVGGVRQKLAAVTAGREGPPAEVFLVPRDNLTEARQAPVTADVLVVPIDTLDDAIEALEALGEDRRPPDAELRAAS